MKKNISYLIIITLLVACSSSATKLTKAGGKIEIVDTKPGKQCSVMGEVVGINNFGNEDVAQTDLRNKTADADGDTVLIKETVRNGSNYEIFGVAYSCNN